MRKTIKILIAIFVLLITVCFGYIYGMPVLIQEKLEGKTPEAKVRNYILAVSKGDEGMALGLWRLSEKNTYVSMEYYDNLVKRRGDITQELINKKISKNFTIKKIEWRSTCCMQSVTNNSRIAGRAKVKTELQSLNGQKYTYIFDVAVPGGYDGGLTQHYVRNWEIRDIYPE